MSTPKPPAGHFALLYFASATSFTRKQHDFLPAPMPLAQLYEAVENKYPGDYGEGAQLECADGQPGLRGRGGGNGEGRGGVGD